MNRSWLTELGLVSKELLRIHLHEDDFLLRGGQLKLNVLQPVLPHGRGDRRVQDAGTRLNDLVSVRQGE